MKTKIRITETPFGGGYKHLYIQILDFRYKETEYLEPIGTISFQMSEHKQNNKTWYAMNFIINTDKFEHLEKMAKLAKFIKTNRKGYEDQPDDIKRLIGGIEYGNFGGEFIPLSSEGLVQFNIMQNGNLWSKLVAPNEIIAQKMLNKKKIVSAVLGKSEIIKF